jgi:signal transduction histidine kinase
MDSFLLIANPDGRITHANELAITRFGSVVGSTLEGLVNAEIAGLILSPQNETGWRGVAVFRGPNEVSVISTISTLSVHEGDVLKSIVLVVRDAELENAEREALLRELLAGTAHGLNNPLAIVTGNADLLLEDPDLATSQREKLESIHRNALRASALLQGLRAFVNRRRPQRIRTHIDAVLNVVLQLKDYDLKTCGIEVETNLGEGLPEVVADAGQLQQVFLNILNNAQEALASTSVKRVVVQTEAARERVLIRVADTGSGILTENLENVFDPFFSTKAGGKGRGLGLFIARRIVEEHGGHIRIESEEGKGTAVTIQLPVAPAVPS